MSDRGNTNYSDHSVAFALLRPGDTVYRIRAIDDALQLEGPHEILKVEKGDMLYQTVFLMDMRTKKMHRTGANVLIPGEWINEQRLNKKLVPLVEFAPAAETATETKNHA